MEVNELGRLMREGNRACALLSLSLVAMSKCVVLSRSAQS